MTLPLKVFIGYDSRETVAFHVLANSIMRHASRPVAIIPLMMETLKTTGIYWRSRGPTESTEFSMTRFLVPYLSNYEGISIFMDCDMLCRADIWELADKARDPNKAVHVCQHDYDPKAGKKFLGQVQTKYPRKNWSSLMVFRNEMCRQLTPHYVNTATGLELHRLLWADEAAIGSLPLEWNWLVGEYPPCPDPKILHYTLGGPYFEDTKDCDHSEEWFAERRHAMSAGKML